MIGDFPNRCWCFYSILNHTNQIFYEISIHVRCCLTSVGPFFPRNGMMIPTINSRGMAQPPHIQHIRCCCGSTIRCPLQGFFLFETITPSVEKNTINHLQSETLWLEAGPVESKELLVASVGAGKEWKRWSTRPWHSGWGFNFEGWLIKLWLLVITEVETVYMRMYIGWYWMYIIVCLDDLSSFYANLIQHG